MRRTLAPVLFLLVAATPQADQRNYLISSFDRLRVDGPYEVTVVEGIAPAARAEGDPKALDQLSIRLEGETLVVGAGTRGWELRSSDRIVSPRITITTPALRTVLVNGGGNVHVAAMHGDRIDLGLNGSGAIDVADLRADSLVATLTGTGVMTLAGEARTARLHANGAGSIEAGDFLVSDATVTSETSGTIHLRARSRAQVAGFGAGAIRIDGSADCAITGSALVSCGGKILPRN